MKVNTIWEFQMRRAQSEAVNKGIGDMAAPKGAKSAPEKRGGKSATAKPRESYSGRRCFLFGFVVGEESYSAGIHQRGRSQDI
jgi:hypothetical protein